MKKNPSPPHKFIYITTTEENGREVAIVRCADCGYEEKTPVQEDPLTLY